MNSGKLPSISPAPRSPCLSPSTNPLTLGLLHELQIVLPHFVSPPPWTQRVWKRIKRVKAPLSLSYSDLIVKLNSTVLPISLLRCLQGTFLAHCLTVILDHWLPAVCHVSRVKTAKLPLYHHTPAEACIESLWRSAFWYL